MLIKKISSSHDAFFYRSLAAPYLVSHQESALYTNSQPLEHNSSVRLPREPTGISKMPQCRLDPTILAPKHNTSYIWHLSLSHDPLSKLKDISDVAYFSPILKCASRVTSYHSVRPEPKDKTEQAHHNNSYDAQQYLPGEFIFSDIIGSILPGPTFSNENIVSSLLTPSAT